MNEEWEVIAGLQLTVERRMLVHRFSLLPKGVCFYPELPFKRFGFNGSFVPTLPLPLT